MRSIIPFVDRMPEKNNAIKYSGGSVCIIINVTELEREVVISVEDNGNGIIDEMNKRILNRFVRGLEDIHGSGLGLYFFRTLIENFGGKIKVEDRIRGDYTQGARFVITLHPARQSYFSLLSPEKFCQVIDIY